MADASHANSVAVSHDLSVQPKSSGCSRLRIWPAVLLLALLWLAKAVPFVVSELGMWGFMLIAWSPLVCALGIVVWWLFASRARIAERLLGLVGLLVIAIAGVLFADASVRGFYALLIYVVPWGITAFAGALVVLHRWRSAWRVPITLLATCAAFGYWDAVRFDGLWGDFHSVMRWRWERTAEDEYVAHLAAPAARPTAAPGAEQEALGPVSWPGFRGPQRDGVVPGVALETDWQAHPPKRLWTRKVGPGWSSFAVAGSRLFTQEQRGDREAVVCWNADTGEERWVLEFAERFFEAVGGAGPRATPTIGDGRLFSLSAVGLLHCLDPVTGKVIWKRDLRTDAQRDPPIWGFSSSPLVAGDVVIVHAGGKEDRGILAYDVRTGDLRWSVPAGDHSYSSPHSAQVGGQAVVLMLTNTGITAIDPAQGKGVWEHPWPTQGYRVVQPLLVDSSSVLLGTGMGTGTRRINLSRSGGQVTTEDKWTSLDMKPDFNDFVAHKGYLYGFDQALFACVDLATGRRQWKQGRYGKGQVLLLPQQDQLLILSETGAAVLLHASPEKLDELARYPLIEGKTWNHPVLVGSRLYVRNGEQAGCFEMPVADAPKIAATESGDDPLPPKTSRLLSVTLPESGEKNDALRKMGLSAGRHLRSVDGDSSVLFGGAVWPGSSAGSGLHPQPVARPMLARSRAFDQRLVVGRYLRRPPQHDHDR